MTSGFDIIIAILIILITIKFTLNIPLFHTEYDKYLNELMDKNTPIVYRDAYTCKFKDTSFYIWTGNFPYAYGCVDNFGSTLDCPYPSLRTRYRLSVYILKNYKPENNKD